MEREAERWGAAPFLQAGGLSLSNFSRTLGFCRIGSGRICGYCFLLCQGSGNQFPYPVVIWDFYTISITF